jgi:hypothetical protein
MVVRHIREPEKQRAGVYGTARQMVSCLADRDVSQWVTPRPGTTVATDPRPQFVPEDFVRGKGTLYSLSRDETGTAGLASLPPHRAPSGHLRLEPANRIDTGLACRGSCKTASGPHAPLRCGLSIPS